MEQETAKDTWLHLGHSHSTMRETQQVCTDFVQAVKDHFLDMLKKLKVHLILHLAQSMADFGPTSSFNTER